MRESFARPPWSQSSSCASGQVELGGQVRKGRRLSGFALGPRTKRVRHETRRQLWNRRDWFTKHGPGIYFSRIAPEPLLVITGDRDTLTPTDEILTAYGDACEPKQLLILPGGHCDLYGAGREAGTRAAVDWFASSPSIYGDSWYVGAHAEPQRHLREGSSLDDGGQRFLGGAPWLQELPEVAALAQRGDPQLDAVGTRDPAALAVADVAVQPSTLAAQP
jgi:hypothetical protein